jgi:hypothetical protein
MQGEAIMKMSRSAGLIVAGMVMLGASPALAHTATSPDGGSIAYTTGSTTLSVKDAKCDGYGAYGYANNTSHRLDNWGGCGTTLSKQYGTITAVQACTNIPSASDPCSSWQ